MMFAERLKSLRKARGLTQRELAGAQLSVSYVSLLESGRRQPTPETVQLLATALACDVDELVDTGATQAEPVALTLAQAELQLHTGQVAGARERYEQVLAKGPADVSTRHKALLGLATSLQRLGRLAEAADVYEQCVRMGIENPADGASLQVVLGWCRCLYELGELEHASEVGSAALAEIDAVKAQESELSIQLLATVAAVRYELGDLRQAERLLDEGMQRASRVKSSTARGAILWNASTLAYERGRFQEALELSDEALAIFRGGTDRRPVGRLLTTRGYFLLRTDPPRPTEALQALEQALVEFADSSDPVDRGYALTELSHAHLALDDVDEAIRTAEESRAQLGTTARLEHARATTALAIALATRGDLDRAKELFTEAGVVLDNLGATRHAARSWIELAHALANAGDLEGALAAHENAARAVHLDDPRWRRPRPSLEPRREKVGAHAG